MVSTIYTRSGLGGPRLWDCLQYFGLSYWQLRGFGNLFPVMVSHFSSLVLSQVLVRKGQSGLGEGDDVA